MIFKDGSVTIGAGPVNATTHKATFTTTKLAVGTHSITSHYEGNASFCDQHFCGDKTGRAIEKRRNQITAATWNSAATRPQPTSDRHWVESYATADSIRWECTTFR